MRDETESVYPRQLAQIHNRFFAKRTRESNHMQDIKIIIKHKKIFIAPGCQERGGVVLKQELGQKDLL